MLLTTQFARRTYSKSRCATMAIYIRLMAFVAVTSTFIEGVYSFEIMQDLGSAPIAEP